MPKKPPQSAPAAAAAGAAALQPQGPRRPGAPPEPPRSPMLPPRYINTAYSLFLFSIWISPTFILHPSSRARPLRRPLSATPDPILQQHQQQRPPAAGVVGAGRGAAAAPPPSPVVGPRRLPPPSPDLRRPRGPPPSSSVATSLAPFSSAASSRHAYSISSHLDYFCKYFFNLCSSAAGPPAGLGRGGGVPAWVQRRRDLVNRIGAR